MSGEKEIEQQQKWLFGCAHWTRRLRTTKKERKRERKEEESIAKPKGRYKNGKKKWKGSPSIQHQGGRHCVWIISNANRVCLEKKGMEAKENKQNKKKMSALKSIRRMQVKKTVDSETTARESGPSFETRVATWQGHGDF